MTIDPAAALSIQDLTVGYDRRPVLWNINLELPKGRLIGIIGPNGSGKTTILKAVLGLLPLASGEIRLLGKPLPEVRLKIAYVPQRSAVDWDFPATALDVAIMGRYGRLGLFRRAGSADKAMAKQALERVGMLDFKNRQIGQLSGGQQQRVFLARAIAQEAELYFLDEPFAGVDIATERTIIELLKRMRDDGKTVIVVHHDLKTATDYFDWAVLLNQRLVANGPVDEVLTEARLQEAYGGRLNVLTQAAELIAERAFPLREKAPKP